MEMNNLSSYSKKLCRCCWQFATLLISYSYQYLLFKLTPFVSYIFYFVLLSLFGFAVLKAMNFRTSFTPTNLDIFFTAVSAATVSSMSTVEMEAFSDPQLVLMTILMFVGGEVFTSMVGLYLRKSKIARTWKNDLKVESVVSDFSSAASSPRRGDATSDHQQQMIELSIVTVPESGPTRVGSKEDVLSVPESGPTRFGSKEDILSLPDGSKEDIFTMPETGPIRVGSKESIFSTYSSPFVKYDSIKFLGSVVLGYLVVVQILGVSAVFIYLGIYKSATEVLKKKGLKTSTFAVFTVVSTFASCGFVPTNENMMVFRTNSGLLWILIPQILLGNTLFPPCLRMVLWILGKRFKKAEAQYLLLNSTEVGYLHLLPGLHSAMLAATVLGFILIGFVLFCSMEWNSSALAGMNAYQKVAGIFFQSANARHTGETIVDLSTIASAVLVFFVVMMYLPPYTSFVPMKKKEEEWAVVTRKKRNNSNNNIITKNMAFSQLGYLVLFIIAVCITERKSIRQDPLNFTVLNIVVEVISAYGNVGFTTGYSCGRRLNPDPQSQCVDKWYGFAGKWSNEGKFILILVMFFGRLKKFNMNGGQAWKLL